MSRVPTPILRLALLPALWLGAWLAAASLTARPAAAQDNVTRVELSSGRSYPITAPAPITRVSVADTAVMDVVVISDRELVINGHRSGEADAIVWLADGTRRHYRVLVRSASDRLQVVLYVKFAEVRRDFLSQVGLSFRYQDVNARVGQSNFNGDQGFRLDSITGRLLAPLSATGNFFTVLTDFGTDKLLALLELEQQRGTARLLAEPNLMAGNRDTATFLAGGELPIPIVQGGTSLTGNQSVTILWREFGVKLRFVGEIIGDDLLRLSVLPEVSSLDYSNAIELSGFRVPALRTRRMSSTLDVPRDQSIVIAGMFNNEQERIRTGVPGLMDLPILGALFSSTRFQRNETELLVVVTPVIVDPRRPRPIDVVPTVRDTAPPAKGALQRPKSNDKTGIQDILKRPD